MLVVPILTQLLPIIEIAFLNLTQQLLVIDFSFFGTPSKLYNIADFSSYVRCNDFCLRQIQATLHQSHFQLM